jgi:hypothetical protein
MWGGEARLAFAIAAACAGCGGDGGLRAGGGAFGGVSLGGLELFGSATVDDARAPEEAVLYAIRARADLTFDAIVCEGQATGAALFWNPIGTLYELGDQLDWWHAAPNVDSHVRVYVALASNVDDALLSSGLGPPPFRVGDLYGATGGLEFHACDTGGFTAQRLCPVDPDWSSWPPIELAIPFPGCGARAGRCTFDAPDGKRCRSSASTLPDVTSQYERECADSGGTYFPNECPREDLVAGCRYDDVLHPDGTTLVDWYYLPRRRSQIAEICATQNLTLVD